MRLKKVVCCALALCLLAGCGPKQQAKLDPENPVTVTLWHYYNGAQKAGFDKLVTEFNETVGLEEGIIVEATNQGNVNQLIENVVASADNKVGTDPIPNIFAGYADTVYQIDQMGLVASLNPYFTEAELKAFSQSYLDEGYIGADDQLKILPTAKSTELLLLNKTDWDLFAAETGADAAALATCEGLVQTAKQYYEWSDAKTPDVLNDGKAFFGRDAMANYMIIGCRQLSHEIFTVKNGEVTFDVDEQTMKTLWDNYYVPYISGYFTAGGTFRADDAKVGDIIALVGSSSSVTYFPTEVIVGDTEGYPIEPLVLPVPVFEGARKVAVQQGAGMAVTESTPEQMYASCVFLKWFTEPARNLEFAILSGYMPVKTEANEMGKLDEAMQKNSDVDYSGILEQSLNVSIQTAQDYDLYTNRAFENGTAARGVLEHALSDKAAADRQQVIALLDGGSTLEQAVSQVNTPENFSAWLAQLKSDLEATR